MTKILIREHIKGSGQTLTAFVCSVLLHIIFFAAFLRAPSHIAKSNENVLTVFPVQFEPLPLPKIEVSKRQIVTPPVNQNDKVPNQTRFLSDKNSSTEVETIKRGDGIDAGAIKSTTKSATEVQTDSIKREGNAPSISPPRSTKQTPSIGKTKESVIAAEQSNSKQLFYDKTSSRKFEQSNTQKITKTLDLSTDYGLLNKLNIEAKQKAKANDNQGTSDPLPFSRGVGANAKFIGVNGTSDFIPDIKDGDITLLNTKADQYAVFVRRVATSVFYHLKDKGWSSLAASDIRAIRQDVVVLARLSKDGKLISAVIQKSSDSPSFDSCMLEAVKSAAHDPHPPSAALSRNGTYDFIFMAKAWSRFGVMQRNGFPREERWLLLKTGLE